MNFKHLFHRHGPDEPCPFMEPSLHRAADGTAGFLARLYVKLHTARCGPCRQFLEKLRQMLAQLKEAKAADPTPETIERLMLGVGGPSPTGR